jgi:outer membrane lipoprotein-sorting protein
MRAPFIHGLTRRSLLLGLAALAGPAFAAPPGPNDAADIARVQAYLNGIHTLQSRFEQVSDDGGVDNGTIYIDSPGRMRVVYDPPAPILIVATGGQIYYYDTKLQQVSRTTVDDTPAWFLLRDRISLGGDITVTDFERSADTLRLTLVETKNPGLGQVTVVLSDKPLALRQWTVLDAQRRKVTVTLQNASFDVALNPSLFYWTDPRPEQ